MSLVIKAIAHQFNAPVHGASDGVVIDYESIEEIVPVITSLVHNNDVQIAIYAYQAMYSIAFSFGAYREYLITSGGLLNLKQKLRGHIEQSNIAVLDIFGVVSSGSHEHTGGCVEVGIIPELRELFKLSRNVGIRMRILWILSNICADCPEYIDLVSKNDLFSVFIDYLRSTSSKLRRHALKCIDNVRKRGTDSQNFSLVASGAIPALCEALKFGVQEDIIMSLRVLDSLLKLCAKKFGPDVSKRKYVYQIEVCGGLDTIESLQEHKVMAISMKACEFLEYHHDVEVLV